MKNHILILGYAEGINYYIKAVRAFTNAPIVIVETEINDKIESLLKNEFVYMYTGTF